MEGMSHSSAHSFYSSIQVPHLWFYGFASRTSHDFIIICLTVAVLCFLKTALAAVLATTYDSASIRIRRTNSTLCMRLTLHAVGCLVTLVELTLGYLLMFAVMVGNVWLCIVIVVTSSLSYFVAFWCRIPLLKPVAAEATAMDQRLALREIPTNSSEGLDSQQGDGMVRDETCETTVFLPKARSDQKLDDKSEPSVSNQDVAINLRNNAALELTSFGRNRCHDYDDTVYNHRQGYADCDTLPVRTPPPDLISYSPSADEGTSMSANHSALPKQRSNSMLLEKYPVLRFHNVEVQDTSPSHTGSRALQMEELDRLLHQLEQT